MSVTRPATIAPKDRDMRSGTKVNGSDCAGLVMGIGWMGHMGDNNDFHFSIDIGGYYIYLS